MAVVTQIQIRRGTAAQWTSANPTLASAEFGYETDTGKFKIGDGSTAWNSLGYKASGTVTSITAGTGLSGGTITGSGTIAIDTATTVDVSTAQTLTNKTLTNPTVNNYTEGVVAIGTVTTSNTLSLTNGTVQTATLTASTACTFTMPTATAGKSFVLMLKQAATTGNGTATFTSVKFNAVGAPTMTATAGKMDIFTFVADGTNWYGAYNQGYTP